MTDLPTLRDLLARVEAATGPSRELDCMIWCVRENRTWRRREDRLFACRAEPPHVETLIGRWFDGAFFARDTTFEMFTFSIDNCIELIRVLPSANTYSINKTRDEFGALVAADIDGEGRFFAESTHPSSAPLAFLAAILRALIARAEKEE